MGRDCNMIRPSVQMEAGLHREGDQEELQAPGAPLTLLLYSTEDKLLTYSKARS